MKSIDLGWKAIIALMILAWLPLFAAELFREVPQAGGFALAWGLTAMPFCMFLAVGILILKLFVGKKP